MEMTEEEALIAQGVENNARQDPSFIERALFVAGIIRELGKTDETRKNAQTIAYRALQIDESLVSRMNRIATGIPMELIHAIGPAHGVGRRVWEKLFRLCEKDVARAREVAREIPRNLPGPDRLDAAVTLLTATKATTPKVEQGERVKIGRKGNRMPEEAHMSLLYLPYVPSLHEDMILRGRRILADQMEFLLASVPPHSRLHQALS